MAEQGDLESIAELAAARTLNRHGAHLWTWWHEIAATRSTSGMGVSRLTRREIHEWEADEGQRLKRWERRVILGIDAAWVASVTETDPDTPTKPGEETP